MRKAAQYFNLISVAITIFVVGLRLMSGRASAGTTYRFERMWPTPRALPSLRYQEDMQGDNEREMGVFASRMLRR